MDLLSMSSLSLPNPPLVSSWLVNLNRSHEHQILRILAQKTGLKPQEQRLFFRGKEKDNEEYLHISGVKEMSKIMLLENPEAKEQKAEEMKRLEENKEDRRMSKASEAVVLVRSEVDNLCEKATALESAVLGGTKVDEKEFLMLTELLMVQLLKLDRIEAEGEAKIQRRTEVCRIQSLVDTLDALKDGNSNPFSNRSNATSVTTQWETFESEVGSLSAAPVLMASSTQVTNDWEQFN
ncbi:uncharacterized protein A4U43_C02F2860 [Asparagus officinalis]|uniref:BAG domain-containing protein n=1 Tax=Asparagus officinalis TaxID=4686 RepID=A0A5P1FFC5_ASPOF|nr:BAG family molecular chaperone regulator 4-like isoform X2 [Asparagus officinalis]ONK77076.1 uncharacterized protein A4U43_C02F2860 [Asparagus officinalis]